VFLEKKNMDKATTMLNSSDEQLKSLYPLEFAKSPKRATTDEPNEFSLFAQTKYSSKRQKLTSPRFEISKPFPMSTDGTLEDQDPVLTFLNTDDPLERSSTQAVSEQMLHPMSSKLDCKEVSVSIQGPRADSDLASNTNSFCVRNWYHCRIFKAAYEKLLAKGGAFAAVEHVQTLVYLHRMLEAAPAFILKRQLTDLSFALALLREILQSTLACSEPSVRRAFGPEAETKAKKFVDKHLRLKTKRPANKKEIERESKQPPQFFLLSVEEPKENSTSCFLDFDAEGKTQEISPKQFMWLRNMMLQSVFPELIPTDEEGVSRPSVVKTSVPSRKLLKQFKEIDHVKCLLQIFASLLYWDVNRAANFQNKFQRQYSNFMAFVFFKRLNNHMAHLLFKKKFSCLSDV